jgi:hypothetical protein
MYMGVCGVQSDGIMSVVGDVDGAAQFAAGTYFDMLVPYSQYSGGKLQTERLK